MSSIEGQAVKKALDTYREMSADLMESIGDQAAGEAMLTDLRAKAAADAAALGIVHGLIAELPRAEMNNGSRSFRLSDVQAVPKVRGSVIWGPYMQYDGVLNLNGYKPWVVPYYLIGNRPKADTEPEMTEILLAPAVEATEVSPELVIATTWTAELSPVESAMAAMTYSKVSPDEVDELFDESILALRLHRRGGVILTAAGASRSLRKTQKAEERVQEELNHGQFVSLPASWHYRHSRPAFSHGLPLQERTDFNVFPRLVHLATLFDKTSVLDGLMDALQDEHGSVLETFVTD